MVKNVFTSKVEYIITWSNLCKLLFFFAELLCSGNEVGAELTNETPSRLNTAIRDSVNAASWNRIKLVVPKVAF